MVARQAHSLKVGSSILSLATKSECFALVCKIVVKCLIWEPGSSVVELSVCNWEVDGSTPSRATKVVLQTFRLKCIIN